MSCNVEKVISKAKAEVGYLEKATKNNLDSKTANAGSNNYTKYARDLDNVSGFYNGRKQGFAWCDVFVDWCFVQAYGVTNAKKLLCQPSKSCGAGVKYSMQYYKNKGQFHTSPKKGDQIFFCNSSGSPSHTGLVVKVDSNYVHTIEGNTSSAAGVVANGGCVAEKKYRLSHERILGYGRPNYDTVSSSDSSGDTSISKDTDTTDYQCIHTVVKGNSLWAIATKHLGKGSRYKEIMALNGLTSITIKPGQKLKIPRK